MSTKKPIPGTRMAGPATGVSKGASKTGKPTNREGASQMKASTQVTKSQIRDVVIEIAHQAVTEAPVVKQVFDTQIKAMQLQVLKEGKEEIQKIAQQAMARQTQMAAEQAAKLEEIRRNSRIEVVIKRPELPDLKLTGALMHRQAPMLIRQVAAGNPVLLIGPTQSGKSKVAEQVAEALGTEYRYHAFGPTQTEASLKGYLQAQGFYVPTDLYYAVKYGYVWMGDEWDTANPTVTINMNNGISNKIWQFPLSLAAQLEADGEHEEAALFREAGGMVRAHPNFRIMGSLNTWGKGADMAYVGRNPIDTSTLARFDKVFWDYDDGSPLGSPELDKLSKDLLKLAHYDDKRDGGLELAIIKQDFPGQESWVRLVQKVRQAVHRAGVQGFAVTPSHSIRGARNLFHGLPVEYVIETSLWAEVKADQRHKILESLQELESELKLDSMVRESGESLSDSENRERPEPQTLALRDGGKLHLNPAVDKVCVHYYGLNSNNPISNNLAARARSEGYTYMVLAEVDNLVYHDVIALRQDGTYQGIGYIRKDELATLHPGYAGEIYATLEMVSRIAEEPWAKVFTKPVEEQVPA